MAGWTLPLQMNVKVDRIDQYFEPPATTRLERAPMPPSQIWGDTRKPAYYVIDGRGNGPSIAINRLLKIGARVAWTTAPLALQGFTYQPGAIVVADGKGVLETVGAIARDLGLRATAAAGRAPQDTRPLARVRVGLYKSWVENIDEGWTRWLLEQYQFPFETIADADIRRGGLRARFDAIVIPDQAAAARDQRAPAGTMPPEYTGGLGTAGADLLRQFVDAGGTLVDARFGERARARSLWRAGEERDARPVAERVFLSRIDRAARARGRSADHGRAADDCRVLQLQQRRSILCPAAAAAGTASSATARIVGRYARSNVLLSGWLEGEPVIAGKGALVELKSGQGRAILFAFPPQHRGQSHATFRLFFNALHTAQAAVPATSRSR